MNKKESVYEILYEQNFKSKDGHRVFRVKCRKCGQEFDMQKRHAERIKSCRHLDCSGRHSGGLVWKNTRLKNIFKGMRERCFDSNSKDYRWYGSKGIGIYEEWLDNPILFEAWSLNNGYKDDLTIDRINENKDYSPENCRWVTSNSNSKYKSTTKEIEVNGFIHTGREWPIYLNLGTNTINKMLHDYTEEQVKEFIKRRLKDKNKARHSHQTWMNVYGLG